MQATLDSLPTFRQTPCGYEATSRDEQHTYVISWNSIDYDVTHYWSQNPAGELIAQTPVLSRAPGLARHHYIQLQKGLTAQEAQ